MRVHGCRVASYAGPEGCNRIIPTKEPDVISRLLAEGWTVARKGTGDHVQYRDPTQPGRVTVDMGKRDQTRARCARSTGWPVGTGETREHNMQVVALIDEDNRQFGVSFPDFPGCTPSERASTRRSRRPPKSWRSTPRAWPRTAIARAAHTYRIAQGSRVPARLQSGHGGLGALHAAVTR